MLTKYIQNEQHYSEVLTLCKNVKKELWIGTADIKDVYISYQNGTAPFLKLISDLLSKRVNVRLLHAKEPGPIFQKDFDKYPLLARDLERAICPRIHFKMIIFDLETVYIGSANLTGAGIGMKSKNRRNFETGILSNEKEIVSSAIEQFDLVWQGSFCAACERKDYCKDRIDKF